MHNLGMDADVMADVVNAMEGEATMCAANPRKQFFLLGGDLNFDDDDNDDDCAGRAEGGRLRRFVGSLVELHQSSPTRMAETADWRMRRLGRFYTALPGWLLVTMSALRYAPEVLSGKGISDHGVLGLSLQGRRKTTAKDRPIPAFVARSQVFAARLLELEAAAAIERGAPYAKLAAMKDMIREAARLAQQELRLTFAGEACGRSMAMMGMARALASTDHGLVAILVSAHGCLREFVSEGGELKDVAAFSHALSAARWAELGGSDSECEKAGGCRPRRSRFAQLWPPSNRRFNFRGIRTDPIPNSAAFEAGPMNDAMRREWAPVFAERPVRTDVVRASFATAPYGGPSLPSPRRRWLTLLVRLGSRGRRPPDPTVFITPFGGSKDPWPLPFRRKSCGRLRMANHRHSGSTSRRGSSFPRRRL